MVVCQQALQSIPEDEICGPVSPSFLMNPNAANNACWTSLDPRVSASATAFLGLFPRECGGTQQFELFAQEALPLQNGVDSKVWKAVQCCIACQNKHDFALPVSERQRGDGYLYQRGVVWWGGYYHHGRYLRESLHTIDRGRAEKALRNKMKLSNTPHFVAPDQQRVTFSDLAAFYLADFKNNGRRSVRDTERIVEQLRGTFGMDKALTITTDRVETYKAGRLAEGRAKATVNRELSALRRMFSLAVKAGRLVWKPASPCSTNPTTCGNVSSSRRSSRTSAGSFRPTWPTR